MAKYLGDCYYFLPTEQIEKDEMAKKHWSAVDSDQFKEKSKIYQNPNPSSKMFDYHTALNEASFKIALEDPTLLSKKGVLVARARQYVHDSGFQFKKKNTRSQSLAGCIEKKAKHTYISAGIRERRVQLIKEDIVETNVKVSLLEKQREKYVAVENFSQTLTVWDQMGEERKTKRKLDEELTILQQKADHINRVKQSKEKTEKKKTESKKTESTATSGASHNAGIKTISTFFGAQNTQAGNSNIGGLAKEAGVQGKPDANRMDGENEKINQQRESIYNVDTKVNLGRDDNTNRNQVEVDPNSYRP